MHISLCLIDKLPPLSREFDTTPDIHIYVDLCKDCIFCRQSQSYAALGSAACVYLLPRNGMPYIFRTSAGFGDVKELFGGSEPYLSIILCDRARMQCLQKTSMGRNCRLMLITWIILRGASLSATGMIFSLFSSE